MDAGVNAVKLKRVARLNYPSPTDAVVAAVVELIATNAVQGKDENTGSRWSERVLDDDNAERLKQALVEIGDESAAGSTQQEEEAQRVREVLLEHAASTLRKLAEDAGIDAHALTSSAQKPDEVVELIVKAVNAVLEPVLTPVFSLFGLHSSAESDLIPDY